MPDAETTDRPPRTAKGTLIAIQTLSTLPPVIDKMIDAAQSSGAIDAELAAEVRANLHEAVQVSQALLASRMVFDGAMPIARAIDLGQARRRKSTREVPRE